MSIDRKSDGDEPQGGAKPASAKDKSDTNSPPRDAPSGWGVSADATEYDRLFMRHIDPSTFIVGTPEGVREEAEDRVRRILRSYRVLREIVARHEATMQKRWAKKTRQQRLKLLLDAWPGMPVDHRPDLVDFRRYEKTDDDESEDPSDTARGAYLWPHISQEDLSGPRNFLLMINARGRNHPRVFADADWESTKLARASWNAIPVVLDGYTMMLNGSPAEDRPSKYGELISWADWKGAHKLQAQRREFSAGGGLLILEVQDRLMRFLADVSRILMQDIPARRLLTDASALQPEPPLRTARATEGYGTLTTTLDEVPYRVPARLDFRRLEAVLKARLDAAEYHLLALREDPFYFHSSIMDEKEHRREIVDDTEGEKHSSLDPKLADEFWARIFRDILSTAYIDLDLLANLHGQVKNIVALEAKHARSISAPECDTLPEEFLYAILKFRRFLELTSPTYPGDLLDILPASPPWRNKFVRMPPIKSAGKPTKKEEIELVGKPSAQLDDLELLIQWHLRVLHDAAVEQHRKSIGVPTLVNELGRIVDKDPTAQQLLSGKLDNLICDYSTLIYCLGQLDLFVPWSRCYDGYAERREDKLVADTQQAGRLWERIMAAFDEAHLLATGGGGRKSAASLGNPDDGKFAYPLDKKRTKENVEVLRRAEKNLDEFWSTIDRIMQAKCGRLAGAAIDRVVVRLRNETLERTTEWVDPAVTKKILSTKMASLELTPEAKGTQVAVDSRALKAFRAVFYNPSVTSSPGSLAWVDFVHAMTSAGFAAEKMYGTMWHFTHPHSETRIEFRQPSTKGKLASSTVRRFGRRLRRSLGYDSDTFILK